MRLRFAPSPTGYLHVGGARTALFNWLLARQSGGAFILRIEDTDRDRSRPEHVEAILGGLRWLGLDWDEGPIFQAEGVERHQSDARKLLGQGSAYRDFTSPEEFAAAREEAKGAGTGSFARLSRELASRVPEDEREARAVAGEPHAVRFRVPEGTTDWADMVHGDMRFENADIDDLVILRSDGTPTYNLAVVSDDAEMEITHVVRGDDHISNTPKQILLYEALGRPVPTFGHVPMILGPDGKRLSKRHGATAVEAYGDLGILPEAMVNFLALLGWSPGSDEELLSTEELVAEFSVERILKAGAVFDTEKLYWFNSQYLSRMDTAGLSKQVVEELSAREMTLEPIGLTDAPLERLIEALKPRSRTVGEMADQAEPFFRSALVYEEAALRKAWFKDPGKTAQLLEVARGVVSEAPWNEEALESGLRAAAEGLEVGAGKLFQPLRLALTGRSASPGIFDVLLILGRERSMERIDKAITMVRAGTQTLPDG